MDSSEIEKRTRAYELEDRVPDLQPSEAEKRELLHETEEKLLKLFKRRFWWAFFIGIAAMWGAVKVVVDIPLKAVEKKLTEAEVLAERAKAAQAATEERADQVKAQLSLRQKDVQDLQEKLTGIEKRFGLNSDQIATADNEARRNTLKFKANEERISRLETLVKQIADENTDNRKAYADYKKQIDAITAETVRDLKRFNENSQYTVFISFLPEQKALAQKVQNELAGAGFKASLSGPPWGSTDPSTGEQWKSSILAYSPANEMKAQEVFALVKEIIKDVRLQSVEPPKPPAPGERVEPPKRPAPGERVTPPPPLPVYGKTFFIFLRS